MFSTLLKDGSGLQLIETAGSDSVFGDFRLTVYDSETNGYIIACLSKEELLKFRDGINETLKTN